MTHTFTAITAPPCIEQAVVIAVTDNIHVLLVKEVSIDDDRHWWKLPSGHVESHESALEAALRESRQETGIYDLPKPMERPLYTQKAVRRHGVHFKHLYLTITPSFMIAPFVDAIHIIKGEKDEVFEVRAYERNALEMLNNFHPEQRLLLQEAGAYMGAKKL